MKGTNNVITTKPEALATNSTAELHPAVVAKVNEVKDIIRSNKGELSVEDLTTGIANSRHLLFNFLMDNNINNVVATMKTVLRENMDFEPTRAQVEAILAAYISKGEYGKLQMIIDGFKFDPQVKNYTTNKAVLALLNNKLRK